MVYVSARTSVSALHLSILFLLVVESTGNDGNLPNSSYVGTTSTTISIIV